MSSIRVSPDPAPPHEGGWALLAPTRVRIPGLINLRDHGGYPVRGGVTVSRRLFRSEAVFRERRTREQSLVDPDYLDGLRALGVRTVVDLRSAEECARDECAWAPLTGATRVPVPIPEGAEGSGQNYLRDLIEGRRDRFSPEDLAEFYTGVLDRRPRELARAVTVVADRAATPVVVHCASGKDRTGLVIALILLALGASRELVVRDYAYTGVLRRARTDDLVEAMARRGIGEDQCRALFDTPESAMVAALDHLDDVYGGAEAYLRDPGGLRDGTLGRLAGHLVLG